jgi:hypothetical protein
LGIQSRHHDMAASLIMRRSVKERVLA